MKAPMLLVETPFFSSLNPNPNTNQTQARLALRQAIRPPTLRERESRSMVQHLGPETADYVGFPSLLLAVVGLATRIVL